MEAEDDRIKEVIYNEEIIPRLHISNGDYHFDDGEALALLLLKGVVFLNSHWWEEDWPEKAQKSFNVSVNCNDMFAWGCADAEGLLYSELEDLFSYWEKDPYWGSTIWVIKKRGEMPQRPVYEKIQDEGIWNLDEMNLTSNHYNHLKES